MQLFTEIIPCRELRRSSADDSDNYGVNFFRKKMGEAEGVSRRLGRGESWRGQLSEKSYKYQGRSRAYGFGEGLGAELSFQRPPEARDGDIRYREMYGESLFPPSYNILTKRSASVRLVNYTRRFFAILDAGK